MTRRRGTWTWVGGILLGLGSSALAVALAFGQPSAHPGPPSASVSAPDSLPAPDAASPAASAPPPPLPPVIVDALVDDLRKKAADIEALLKGQLDTSIEPASLFDVRLDDEPAIELESRRLAAMLDALDRAAAETALHALEDQQGPPDDEADAGDAADAAAPEDAERRSDAGPPKGPPADAEPADAAGDDAGDGAGTPSPTPPPSADPVAEARLAARLALDRARLMFYRLPKETRDRLLAEHATNVEATKPAQEAEAAIGDAERRANEAEQERQRALETAARARTDALRLAGEEYARLLGVAKDQADFEARLQRTKLATTTRNDELAFWTRRVTATLEAQKAGASASEADRTYDELRATLRGARDALDVTLDEMRSPSGVPTPGEDRLATLGEEIEAAQARRERETLLEEVDRLHALEEDARAGAAKALYREIVALNHERLRLYEALSSAKRDAITGFGPTGRDQALAELRQVWLIARYHWAATGRFTAAFRSQNGARAKSAQSAAWLLIKWAFPLALFVLWRRRAKGLLDRASELLRARGAATASMVQTRGEKWVSVLARARGPIEWLVLTQALLALLSKEASELLEVQLVSTVVTWSVAGACVVLVIDALAGEGATRPRASRMITSHIRLRSLKLIGRVVVAVAVLLSVTETLVGDGTIYHWVLSTCWWAIVPLAIVLVRWWREAIFERVELKRKKSLFDSWVLERRSGWASPFVAIAAGATLFAVGAWQAGRIWITSFELTRRALAYLFRRGMSKRAEEAAGVGLSPLQVERGALLAPTHRPDNLVTSVADAQVQSVVDHATSPSGGLFAVVGERGSGKTTMLDRAERAADGVIRVSCEGSDPAALARALASAANVDGGTIFEVTRRVGANAEVRCVLVDDAHRLIVATIGGLETLDIVLDAAGGSSDRVTWIFAFDDVVWRFVERARGAQPLFDDLVRLSRWREDGIGRLLASRTKEAGLHPSFEGLLEELPPNADDVDRAEAIERVETGYYRLIWDYARGNPGIALHTWTGCLGLDPDGHVAVRLFQAPDTTALEALPDSALFVLRAVLQLDLADPVDVARATMLAPTEIADALRFALARGYLEQIGGRYRITWTWLRPITGLLDRRHLLF
ncbi:MAG: AAA family ATPase [Polyangiaceae bacterium]|nr:AAA family ATPase [Polyangiaceae bacterium]